MRGIKLVELVNGKYQDEEIERGFLLIISLAKRRLKQDLQWRWSVTEVRVKMSKM
jgi:hypothetical protein